MDFTVTIVGGGPAGLSCALWLANQGYRCAIVEKQQYLGGMLRINHHLNDWLIGFSNMTGYDIAETFRQHVSRKNISFFTEASLTSISLDHCNVRLMLSTPVSTIEIETSRIVIATGTKFFATEVLYKLSDSYPEQVFVGSGDLKIDTRFSGRRVAVLGGGDNAFENALWLANAGAIVSIYCRSMPRARKALIEQCLSCSKVKIFTSTTLENFEKRGRFLYFNANGSSVYFDYLVVMYGYKPNTEWLIKLNTIFSSTLDSNGFMKTDTYQKTSLPKVYAVGDVTNHPFQSLPQAVAQGAIAAKALVLELEAN